MNSFEMWHLIFEGFTAIGTVGAVIVSLWLASPNRKRFVIKDFKIRQIINEDKSEECILFITFENRQIAQMEIYSLTMEFTQKENISGPNRTWEFKEEYISLLSQSVKEIRLERIWGYKSLDKTESVILTIKTSLGDEVMEFRKSSKKFPVDRLINLVQCLPPS